jgi:retron-type reverse transcriptase
MSKGSTIETLDGIHNEWFERISKEIGSGAFSFLDISKTNGGIGPLGIVNPRHKVVLEALRLILNAIFEPTFSPHSHGFISGKSCHTALHSISLTFQGVNWFVEGDLSKCFDTFDHKLMVKAVEARINDQVFMDLLWKA